MPDRLARRPGREGRAGSSIGTGGPPPGGRTRVSCVFLPRVGASIPYETSYSVRVERAE